VRLCRICGLPLSHHSTPQNHGNAAGTRGIGYS
jgi:hypothetical protein